MLPTRYRDVVAAALRALGKKRVLLAIHDVSFPADPDEDPGRGSPGTRAAERFLEFMRELGFSGVQLGPQGQTSIDNPSPYDGTAFSRNVASLPLRIFREEMDGLVPRAELDAAVAPPRARADNRRAHVTLHRLARLAFDAFRRGARRDLEAPLARFWHAHGSWLAPDALYFALRDAHGGAASRDWHDDLDENLLGPALDAETAAAARRMELETRHAADTAAYGFAQMILDAAHARLRAHGRRLGLELFGDFQIGVSDCDAWSQRASLMRAYRMGAPPSRTNPKGQPWGYPIVVGERFLVARADKAFTDYDSLRLDHPHGLVCPWVYTGDVRAGARLFESPDLPDHVDLAGLAIARADQIDRTQARHADGWVVSLDNEQVDRYAASLDTLVAIARRRGRDLGALVCEVLSTMPYPLARVLERHRLGRFRVTQKANLDDAHDVYRTENARREDWVMLGTHDTPPVFGLLHAWDVGRRQAWAGHLTRRLGTPVEDRPGALAQAMLAELFVCAAENVSIFFGDLFGAAEPYNVPGTIAETNWSLRLPADFEALYGARVARSAALNLPAALALALAARGEADLAARCRALAGEVEEWGRAVSLSASAVA